MARENKSGTILLCREEATGLEQMGRGGIGRGVKRTEKLDVDRGGAEERGTDMEEGENRCTGEGRRNSGNRFPI